MPEKIETPVAPADPVTAAATLEATFQVLPRNPEGHRLV